MVSYNIRERAAMGGWRDGGGRRGIGPWEFQIPLVRYRMSMHWGPVDYNYRNTTLQVNQELESGTRISCGWSNKTGVGHN